MSAGESKRTVAQHAGVMLLREDGALLLQQRDNRPDIRHPGIWTNPGGRCESGEPIEECARREFYEETGYRCGPLRLLGTFVDDFGPKWPLATARVFCALYDNVQPIRCYEGRTMKFVERAGANHLPVLPALLPFWDAAIALLSSPRRRD